MKKQRLPQGLIVAMFSVVIVGSNREGRTDDLAEPVKRFRDVVTSKQVKPYSEAALSLRRWMIANDPFRPKYHFTGPENWINDPNGPIYCNGKYHLFYQFTPFVKGSRHGMCWGHAVSEDLVHWVDWPVAIWPDSRWDRGGVYSGNTLLDGRGRLSALYTGNVRGHAETYGMLAWSDDGGVTWAKKMVMDDRQRPNEKSPVHWDGFTWQEANQWHQLVGGTDKGQGAAWLWASPDLEHWTLQKNIAPTIKYGDFWELPYLIPLGNKHVLLVGSGNPYWVGTYDKTTMMFTPDQEHPRSIDNGTYYSFNLNMVDNKGPGGTQRRIMHGWATIGRSPTQGVPYWESAHSIPRVLTLRDHRVWQEPIPELQVLRGRGSEYKNLAVAPESANRLRNVKGDAMEIRATFRPGTAQRFGVRVRTSATDPKTALTVWFDAKGRTFGAKNVSMESDLKPGDPVTMRIFVDRSIVEVYVNGHANTTSAFHDPAAQGIDLFAEGGTCMLESLDVWPLRSAWE
jgi:beta-fructofuranosidase